MKSILFSVLALVVLFLSLSCSESYDYSQASLGLGLRDYSCTEAWIEVQIGSNDKTANIYIKKNDEIIQTVKVGESETLFYFDNLLPNTAYKFDAVTYEDGKEVKSNPVTFTTLDTTSHNFTWQTFTFGDAGAGSSTLYDVAIINENDIWAVGEIYMNDSLGNPDPTSYNAVHWNGTNWELKKIKTNACGGVDYPLIKSTFAFSSNDILFAHIDGSISHFNGIEFTNDCSLITQLNGSANKIWGISKNNFYVVSGNGFIAHHQNGSWTKIESGTDLETQDIWGISNIESTQQKIFCIASDKYQLIDKKVYRINNNSVTEILNEGLPWSLSSIWFNSRYKCYIVGDGLFIKNLPNNTWQNITQGITPYYTHSIRGSGFNDIVVAGSFGELLHFNGSTWYSYKGRELPEFVGNYFAIGINGYSICAVGQATINSNVAIIAIGRKN